MNIRATCGRTLTVPTVKIYEWLLTIKSKNKLIDPKVWISSHIQRRRIKKLKQIRQIKRSKNPSIILQTDMSTIATIMFYGKSISEKQGTLWVVAHLDKYSCLEARVNYAVGTRITRYSLRSSCRSRW